MDKFKTASNWIAFDLEDDFDPMVLAAEFICKSVRIFSMQRLEHTISRAAPDLEGVCKSLIGALWFPDGQGLDQPVSVATRPPGGGPARPGWAPGGRFGCLY